MTVMIDALEAQFDDLRKEEEKLNWLFRNRNIKDHNYYQKKTTTMVGLYFPNLKTQCETLIENCAIHTDENGFTERVDFIKDFVWSLYGHVVGERLGSVKTAKNNKESDEELE